MLTPFEIGNSSNIDKIDIQNTKMIESFNRNPIYLSFFLFKILNIRSALLYSGLLSTHPLTQWPKSTQNILFNIIYDLKIYLRFQIVCVYRELRNPNSFQHFQVEMRIARDTIQKSNQDL